MIRRFALASLALILAASGADAQERRQERARPTLTIDQITQDPQTWIGDWPEAPYWTDRGDRIYFTWNPDGQFPGDSLFSADPAGGDPVLVSAPEARDLPPRYTGVWTNRLAYGPNLRQRVFERGGDLYLYNIGSDETQRLTQTTARESAPRFSPDGYRVVFREGNHLFAYEPFNGGIRQLTDLRSGSAPAETIPTAQEAYLRDQQTRLLDVIREGVEQDSLREAARERESAARGLPPTHYVGSQRIGSLQIDPTERYVTFSLSPSGSSPTTSMTDYVTASGYAEEITARAKVGADRTTSTLHVQDLVRDTVYTVDLSTLPGAFVASDFLREKGQETDSTRQLFAIGPDWSPDGRYAVVEVRTIDNKDRWIARLDPASGALTVLDHQRDEAWIAGPG
ncbi:MAG: S9 family peptidase, partial [Bacteroidota bacterium]